MGLEGVGKYGTSLLYSSEQSPKKTNFVAHSCWAVTTAPAQLIRCHRQCARYGVCEGDVILGSIVRNSCQTLRHVHLHLPS
jgi:hypothetical protein